ncbi:ubiquinol-cytochrome c reductase core protein 2 [Oratosquilla oratoria]|uniref:ubiquinol-cytochrome c reductase core protein 2 n=1 Tax=Oratosquilla oratoria TaxID=337810 RepID=UPI003F76D3F5
MASKVTKPGLLKNVVQRGYAAQAAAQQSSYALPRHETQVTTLPSGAVVASLENNAPVSRVALLFKAGSRHETSPGTSHMARICAGLSTTNATVFGITRKLQQLGSSLTCETGREHIMYNLDVIRDNLSAGMELLNEVGTKPLYKPWEILETIPRLKADLALCDPTAVTLNDLHKVAFRTGLGNSLFVPSYKIGKVSSDELLAYAAATHTAGGMAVVGLGVDHDALVAFAKGLGVGSGSAAAASSTFGGGEIRNENGAGISIITVGGEGASIGSADAASLAVAQYILGVGAGTKRGSNAGSKLGQALIASGTEAVASAVNANYSDSGLFGYCIAANSSDAGKLTSAIHDMFMNLNVSEEDVANGKKQVQAAIHMASESSAELLDDMGLQALLTGSYSEASAMSDAIDAVTPFSVNAAVSKVMNGKLSMASTGTLSHVPYIDQL